MKTTQKIYLSAALLLALAFFTNFSRSDEQAAIKAVIEKEMTLLANRDTKAWATCFKHDSQTVYCGASVYERFVYQGWETLRDMTEKQIQAMTAPVKYEIERSNWNIHQHGNIAYATFDQELVFENWPGKNPTKEIRCLEKIGGEWKITASSWTEKTQLNTPQQRADIQSVIELETQSFFDHDFDTWAAKWSQDGNAMITYNNQDGSATHLSGFGAISAAVKEGMKEKKTPYSIRRDNWSFAFAGNLATVYFDQYFTNDKGKIYNSKESRIMTWHGDHWLILEVNALYDFKNVK
jgi:hypothetical protein